MSAWTASISSTGTSLSDLAAGLTDDVVVEGEGAGGHLHATRFDATGAYISAFQDDPSHVVRALGNLVVDAQNDFDFATFSQTDADTATLSVTKVDRCGGNVFAVEDARMGVLDTYASVFRGLGADAAGDVSALFLPGTGAEEQFARALYNYSPTGEARPITSIPFSEGDEIFDGFASVSPDGDVVILEPLYTGSSLDFGCGPVTYSSPPGTMVMFRLSPSGACIWSKALAVAPSPALISSSMAFGADGTLALALAYSGTIDLGGGPFTSSGPSALAVARFDGAGNHLWSKSFGGADASFQGATVHPSPAGTLLVTSGYSGTVDLGAGALPASGDTLVAAFDGCGNLRWNKATTVGSGYTLLAAAGSCGAFVATNSPTADLGGGPLATSTSVGLVALGL